MQLVPSQAKPTQNKVSMPVVDPTPEELGPSYWQVYIRMSTLYLLAETSFKGDPWYEDLVRRCYLRADDGGVIYSQDLVEIFFLALHDYDFNLLNILIDATAALLAL